MPLRLAALAAVILPALAVAQEGRRVDPAKAAPADKLALGGAAAVFVGTIDKAAAGPVGLSEPPLYSYTLEFKAADLLRGPKPDGVRFGYQFRGERAGPPLEPGTPVLVVARKTDSGWQVMSLHAPDKETLAKAKLLAALPVGWKAEGGKPVSPWAALGDKAWPKDGPKPAGAAVCAASGRPALLAGPDIELTVEQVLPPNRQQFRNPYGNGQFKVTVTNKGEKPTEVPALLTDGKGILWADSLVVVQNGVPKLLPGAGKATTAKAVTLKPGEAVSGVIDVLPLPDLGNPGGSRLYFDFALGERAATNFFYYFQSLHGPMRAAALKKLAGE